MENKIKMLSPKDIQKTLHLEQSRLLYSKRGNSIYEWLEISMPYLIMYEAIHPENDATCYFEFCEQQKIIHYSSYHEFTALGNRPLHSHNFYEMTFVLSGALKLQIENEVITYQPGDCCLCNKNIHHKEIMDQDTEIVLFLMKEEFIKDMLATNFYYDAAGEAHPLGSFFYKLFSENRKNAFYDAKEYVDFRMNPGTDINACYGIINEIIEEISGTHSGKSHMIKALFCRFIELLEDSSRIQRTTHKASLSGDELLVLKIAGAYQDRDTLFTRRELEDFTGYNGDYLERIIKKNTGMTLNEYGRSFLMKKAALMLQDTNYGIGEICEKLGYSNRNYFNRLFMNCYGMLPSQYRSRERTKLHAN